MSTDIEALNWAVDYVFVDTLDSSAVYWEIMKKPNERIIRYYRQLIDANISVVTIFEELLYDFILCLVLGRIETVRILKRFTLMNFEISADDLKEAIREVAERAKSFIEIGYNNYRLESGSKK